MLTLVKNSGFSLGSCSQPSEYSLARAQLKLDGLSEHPGETPHCSDLYCVFAAVQYMELPHLRQQKFHT